MKQTSNIRNIFIKILKISVFLSVGILLFWLVYKDQKIDDIKTGMKNADLKWLLFSAALGILSHISRAVRWKILLRPLGYKPKTYNLFFSVMIMYLSNLAIPRSGEIVRCGVVDKYEKIPFSKLLGTVFTERVIDFIMLFILLGIVIVTQASNLKHFIDIHPEIYDRIHAILGKGFVLGIILLLFFITAIVLYVKRNRFRNNKIYIKISDFVKSFYAGIKTVIQLEQKWWFFFHTVFIWTMYFVMIYVCFKSFDFTENLSLLTGLTVFVMTAFGMVMPSPGGIGTWHFMAIEALALYGVANNDAKLFAFATHGTQTLMLLIVGLISLLLIPIVNKTYKKDV